MNHRSIPPQLGPQPALSVLGESVGTCASSAFRATRLVACRPLSSPPRLRFARATLRRSGDPLPAAPRRFALRPPLAHGFRRPLRLRHTPPAPSLWGSLPRLCISLTPHPHVFRIRKKGGVAASLQGFKFTQSIRLPPCRECWNPTLSPLPSPADRRTAPTGYARPRPARQHHRDV